MRSFIKIFLFIVIIRGSLSYNPTLLYVGLKRQRVGTAHIIPRNVKVIRAECRVGLPNAYGNYIGQEVWFLDDHGGLFGPWLVTDVESKSEAVYSYSIGEKRERVTTLVNRSFMEANSLAADVDCLEMVYRKGSIVIQRRAY